MMDRGGVAAGRSADIRVTRADFDQVSLQTGLLLSAFPLVLAALVCVGLAMGVDLVRPALPLTLAIMAGAGFTWPGARISLTAFLIAAAIIVLSILIGAQLLDASYDGNSYRRHAPACLLNGWNPLWGDTCNRIWTNDYPLMSWIFSAAQWPFTGTGAAGMGLNLIVMVGVGLVSQRLLRDTFSLSRRNAAGLAILLVGNPVVAGQVWTAYVDGLVYLYCALGILALARLTVPGPARFDPQAHAMLAISVAAMPALKFTGLVFGFLFMAIAAGLVFVAWRKGIHHSETPRRDVGRWSALAMIYGLFGGMGLIICFHPYATNLLAGEHLFHPVMGSETAEFVDALMPACVEATSRILRPFHAMLYGGDLTRETCLAGQAIQPLGGSHGPTLHGGYAGNWLVAGFGNLMPVSLGLLGLAIGLRAVSAFRRPLPGGAALTMLMGLPIALAMLIGPNWWARYVPFLWLLVPAGLLLARGLIGPIGRVLAICMAAAGGIPVLASFTFSTYYAVKYQEAARAVNPAILSPETTLGEPGARRFVASYHDRLNRYGFGPLPIADQPIDCPVGTFTIPPVQFFLTSSDTENPPANLSSMLTAENRQTVLLAGDNATAQLSQSEMDTLKALGLGRAALEPGAITVIGQPLPRIITPRQAEAVLPNGGSVRIGGIRFKRADRGITVLAFSPSGRFLTATHFGQSPAEDLCP